MRRRFVLLRHVVREAAAGRPEEAHHDLLVEADAAGQAAGADAEAGAGAGSGAGPPLVTFQLDAAGPPARGRRTPDHRRAWLELEGPVSGGRGRVTRLDAGEAEDVEGDPRAARWRARFAGARLAGLVEVREDAAGAVALARVEGPTP